MYNHFKVENVQNTTFYYIINRYESGPSAENKKILKRKGKKMIKVKSTSLLLLLTITLKQPLERSQKIQKFNHTH